MQQSTIAQNNKLFFKVVKNNKLGTVRIVCAYFSTGITQKNAAYASGDMRDEDVTNALQRISTKFNNATMQQIA